MQSVSPTVRVYSADGIYLRDVPAARVADMDAQPVQSRGGRVRRVVMRAREGERVLLRLPMPAPATYREALPTIGRQVIALKRVGPDGCLVRW